MHKFSAKHLHLQYLCLYLHKQYLKLCLHRMSDITFRLIINERYIT